jgi:hypothetical protein
LASVGTTDSWRKQHIYDEVQRLTTKALHKGDIRVIGYGYIGTVQDLIYQNTWVCDKAESK